MFNVKRMRRDIVEDTNNSEAQSRSKIPRVHGQQWPDALRYGQNENLEEEIPGFGLIMWNEYAQALQWFLDMRRESNS